MLPCPGGLVAMSVRVPSRQVKMTKHREDFINGLAQVLFVSVSFRPANVAPVDDRHR